eukprot:scaffold8227_cov119-Isochrysis_galbana.AAC.1
MSRIDRLGLPPRRRRAPSPPLALAPLALCLKRRRLSGETAAPPPRPLPAVEWMLPRWGTPLL